MHYFTDVKTPCFHVVFHNHATVNSRENYLILHTTTGNSFKISRRYILYLCSYRFMVNLYGVLNTIDDYCTTTSSIIQIHISRMM